MMDRTLINQINQAVDRGDDLVKHDLLAKAEEIKRFMEEVKGKELNLNELLSMFESHPEEGSLIICLMYLLGFCLDQMLEEGQKKPPRWVITWYKKAHAWHSAVNLEVWDAPYDA